MLIKTKHTVASVPYNFSKFKFKGYLRYKTITSQNVLSYTSHRLIIFLFRKKIMFRSQGIQVFLFLTIP